MYDGSVLLQRWPCSLTELGDGRPGAIWRGVAYALLAGDRIDIAAPPPSAPDVLRHAVLAADEASWILIAGPATARQQAETALRDDGIMILRAGRWLGEAVDDVVFDWFFRTDRRVDADQIAQLLGAAPSAADTPAKADTQALVLEQRIAWLLAEVARLKAAPVPAAIAAKKDDSAERTALALAAEATAALTEMSRRLDASQGELDRLRAARVPPKVQGELTAAIAMLRPDIAMLRSSLTVAFGEYYAREGVLRAIQELPLSGARPDGWKALRGAERWWERHVSTGKDDSGRAYARFDTTSRRWSLLLSWKSDQIADIAWLRRL